MTHDPITRPRGYDLGATCECGAPVEPIQIEERLDFCRGNAVKYLVRAGRKNPATEVEDLRKAAWYVERAIALATTPPAPTFEELRRIEVPHD